MPLQSAELFKKMAGALPAHGEKIVPQVQCVYAFELREKKDGAPTIFTLDLKNGKGQVKEGTIDGVKPDATFVMLDSDFVALSTGKLTG